MSYFIVLTLYLPNTELISIFLLNNELRTPPIQALLCNSMLTHGFSPDGFNVSIIQPLVKNNRKSMNGSGNYRAIALGSPVSKNVEWIILNKNVCEFETSDMQYGFKAKSSTTQCTFAMMETVNYYRST